MRSLVLFLTCLVARAQIPGVADESLTRAYEALRARDYETAIAGFLRGLETEPARAAARKDLAYTYLKIGENELAREEFRRVMRLDPTDTQAALEYAFLCFETRQPAEARRTFDRLRKAGNPVAERAFRDIDGPLAAAIERWEKAIDLGADQFSVQFELATLLEQRDELERAACHYEMAWRLRTERRSVLVDLGRVLQSLHRTEKANAVLLAASRGGETRAAEAARELLPHRYPYVPEFRRALEFDPGNIELRRELGFLLLRMGRQPEAEEEFRILTETAPGDLLSAAQLGFLLLARNDRLRAMPLLERVLAGSDADLANRVRAVLRVPQLLETRGAKPVSVDARLMAERSIRAGYLKDALKYLQMAHEADPGDSRLMLQLGWTYNILHQDGPASQWFELARHGSDPEIAAEAERAYRNLREATAPVRTTVWLFPVYSTRWRDLFSYGQIKTEFRLGLPVRPYVSTRLIGDTRVTLGPVSPQYLSESSVIAAIGLSTAPWHGIMAWAEAGSAIAYASRHMLPDYRAGISVWRNLGKSLPAESSGWFAASNTDAVFISRFANDFLVYQQTRFGYTLGGKPVRAQLYWNGNLTFDSQRQDWANFGETGPGIRIRASFFPKSMFLMLDAVRGFYFTSATYRDLRAGIWYALTR